ncbi:putative gustatory receptor 28b [Periplaneta americana]|uniref:putative gustatory receptor 28b n=1 Tax=Periplaneta americana TaxID=6978 RepID=UPI0037E8099F
MVPEESLYVSSSDKCSKQGQKFYKLRVLHFLLCDVASNIDQTYGFQILLDIATALINITTYLYFCLLYTLQLHSYENVIIKFGHMLSVHLLWLAMYVLKVVFINVSCDATGKEAALARILIQKILFSFDLDAEAVFQLEAFSKQLLFQKLSFSACGFFYLNRSVLCSIAGAVTTYLVILLQFQISL